MQGFSNPCIFGPRIDVGDSNIYSGIFYYMALAELDVIYLTMVAQNRKSLSYHNIILFRLKKRFVGFERTFSKRLCKTN